MPNAFLGSFGFRRRSRGALFPRREQARAYPILGISSSRGAPAGPVHRAPAARGRPGTRLKPRVYRRHRRCILTVERHWSGGWPRATAAERPDFFISRAGADAPFAAEIGRILEDAGHTVVLQQWDFANRNFMERMHAALESGARVIALLSNEYLASDHCAAEWQNAIAHDPLNKQGRLIVVRVAECHADRTAHRTRLLGSRAGARRSRPVARHRAHRRQARPPQGRRGPRRAVLAGAAPGRARRDQGDAELHRARGRAGVAARAAVGGPHRGRDPAGRRARARRHRQVGARARVRASEPGRLRRRLVAKRRASPRTVRRASRASSGR